MCGEGVYLKDRWCQFDASMLFFIVVSIIFQALQAEWPIFVQMNRSKLVTLSEKYSTNPTRRIECKTGHFVDVRHREMVFAHVRPPSAEASHHDQVKIQVVLKHVVSKNTCFLLLRCIRVFLKFSMPKARINQIFKRSSNQIYNVTIFFLFFMSLYGLLGKKTST